jgi:hypothetical protein
MLASDKRSSLLGNVKFHPNQLSTEIGTTKAML